MAKPIDKEYLKKALKNFDEEILGNKYLQEKDTKVQADWNETDTASEAFIKNKPEIISEERVTALETPTFTQATTRANIASGESTKTILGKIKKYFTDLKTHAFNTPANNLTTTTEGYALDARQGKALQDKIGSTDISGIGSNVTAAISAINTNLTGRLNNLWVNLEGASIFDYITPATNNGIYAVYNSSDAPGGVSFYNIIKMTECMIAVTHEGRSIFKALARTGQWERTWVDITKIGETDISAIGDGTVTGAISTLNSRTKNFSDNLLSSFNMGTSISFEQLRYNPMFFTNWHDSTNFPSPYGSGMYIPGLDATCGYIIYMVGEKMYMRYKSGGTWGNWIEK